MKESQDRIGIERLHGKYLAVRVAVTSGRPDVREIRLLDKVGTTEYITSCQPALITYAVPENILIAKHLKLDVPVGISIDECLRFEMSQSLLDAQSAFDFYFTGMSVNQQYLGLAWRPTQIALKDELNSISMQLLPRSAALIDGYWTFALNDRPEFVAFIDLVSVEDASKVGVTVSFSLSRKLISSFFVEISRTKLNKAPMQIAKEFQTLLSFQLEALFRLGVTRPLGQVIICGDGASTQLQSACAGVFSYPVSVPAVNYGYLASIGETDVLPEHCLSTLGLTVMEPVPALVN